MPIKKTKKVETPKKAVTKKAEKAVDKKHKVEVLVNGLVLTGADNTFEGAMRKAIAEVPPFIKSKLVIRVVGETSPMRVYNPVVAQRLFKRMSLRPSDVELFLSRLGRVLNG